MAALTPYFLAIVREKEWLWFEYIMVSFIVRNGYYVLDISNDGQGDLLSLLFIPEH